MMKSLLIGLTVLTIACTANAALLLSVDGIIDPPDFTVQLMPSDTVVIDIFGDGQTAAPTAVWLLVQDPGAISGGVNLYPGSLSSIYTYVPGSGDGFEDLLPWFDSMGYANVVGASYADFAHGGAPQPPLEGLLADGIVFHAEGGLGETVLTLASVDLTEVYDIQVIQTPEPVTFALLGIGGLFLRRCK